MSIEALNTLASRLRWARGKAGMKQSDLAKKAGTTQNQIHKIESGQTVQPRNIGKIAKALDVSPAWLQFGDARIDKLDRESLNVAVEFNELSTEHKGTVLALIRALSPKG